MGEYSVVQYLFYFTVRVAAACGVLVKNHGNSYRGQGKHQLFKAFISLGKPRTAL